MGVGSLIRAEPATWPTVVKINGSRLIRSGMDSISAANLEPVLDALVPERRRLIELLSSLDASDWDRPTECPAYSIKGIATHILGDDLSLLSRQRDGAVPGLIVVAEDMPGADFRQLLDGFNDQWVRAARFFSPALLLELLEKAGEWTHDYYRHVDPAAPGEPVPLFNPTFDGGSPFWQAIAREYLERWVHHSQIRRALEKPSLSDSPFFEVGIQTVATAADRAVHGPDTASGGWMIGELELGDLSQAADILTLAHTADEVASLVRGPDEAVKEFANRTGRRTDGE